MKLEQTITQLADQCVKCGMCLPACPTYQLKKNENESPRGRIALMQGIVSGELVLDKKVTKYLDHCVNCLSCEKICPSTVQYQTLIDSIREYTVNQQQNYLPANITSTLLKPAIKNTVFNLLRLYQASGLQFLLRATGLLKIFALKEADALLPQLSARLKPKSHYPKSPLDSQQHAPATVALFTGCMGTLFEQQAVLDSIKVLTQLGFNVDIPEQQCCGALHQHSGYTQQANSFAEHNKQAFLNHKKYTAILFTASGCGAQLKASLNQNRVPVNSVMQFVFEYSKLNRLTLNPIKQHIALHQPCSLKNVLHEEQAVIELLHAIPQLVISGIEAQCCGAAGKNMLTQAKLAKQIRTPILKQVDSVSPDIVVSSNIGCALHLKAGLENNIALKHPIELLAASLN